MDYVPHTKFQWVGFLLWFFFTSSVEYFLGKTDKVKASSILELVFCLIAGFFAILFVALRLGKKK